MATTLGIGKTKNVPSLQKDAEQSQRKCEREPLKHPDMIDAQPRPVSLRVKQNLKKEKE